VSLERSTTLSRSNRTIVALDPGGFELIDQPLARGVVAHHPDQDRLSTQRPDIGGDVGRSSRAEALTLHFHYRDWGFRGKP
jgi:hypothetical protein